MTKIFISIAIILSSLISCSQGTKIEIKIKNLKNQDVILGHHFNAQLIPDDTITLNKKGIGTFLKKDAYPGGMYFIFLPSQSLFDFILDKDQDFTIIADTSNFIETVSFEGSEENTFFSDYQKKMKQTRDKQAKLFKDIEAVKGNEKKEQAIKQEINTLVEGMNTYHTKMIAENKDMFFSKFLTATRRPEVPKTITDKKEQYFWFRNHYFDNFDVSDPRLLRTPIYNNTIDDYVEKVLVQHPDTLIPEVDMLIEKSRTSPELFRNMLVNLFNKFASSQIMTSENVFVHIAEKYYIKESTWSNPEYIKDLKVKVAHKKKCLIGNTAYNINYAITPSDTSKFTSYITGYEKYKAKGLQIEKSSADSAIKYNLKVSVLEECYNTYKKIGKLQDVTANYTILWFWTPSCSHCRKDTPKFYDMYMTKDMKGKGVEVISIYNTKDITSWKKFSKDYIDWLEFLQKHDFKEWQNVWNPFDRFRINYDIKSSTVLYLLDKDKKILAKKISYEQAFEIIENDIKVKE